MVAPVNAGRRTPTDRTRVAELDDMPATVAPGDEAAAQRVDAWFHTYATTRDPAVYERIIHAYLGMADRLAMRYRATRSAPFEDVRQAARLGLIQAVDRYDVGRGTPFVPFAVATILGTIKRSLRDTSWQLHVPRGVRELSLRVFDARDALSQQLGRAPTIAQLASRLGVADEEVLEAMEAAQTRTTPSLDQPVGADGAGVLADLVVDDRFREAPEDLLVLPELVGRLPARERDIVLLRFVDELAQDEIAARMGISQMHVSRLLRRALARLRAGLVEA
jgi:RNA polymerase sigma-B factor